MWFLLQVKERIYSYIPAFWLTTAVAMTLLLAWATRQVQPGRFYAIRGHLRFMTYVWGLLVAYYLLDIIEPASELSWERLAIPGGLGLYLSGRLLWQLGLAFALFYGNSWLRRAIGELELGNLPGARSRSGTYPAAYGLGGLPHSALDWATLNAIPWMYLLSLLLILVVGLVPPDLRTWLVRDTDSWLQAPQLLVTAALFLRLSYAYSRILKNFNAARISFTYSFSQLLLVFVVGTASPTEWALSAFRLLHGGVLVAIGIRFHNAQRLDLPLKNQRAAVRRQLKWGLTAPARLTALGSRLELRSTLLQARSTVVISTGLALILLLWGGGVRSLLTAFPGTVLILVPVSMIILLLSCQCWYYLCFAGLRPQVDWYKVREAWGSELEVDARSDGRLRTLSLSLTRTQSGQPELDAPPPRQIILLHGLFSSGEAAWGLLPLLLLSQGVAEQVHLVSYPHYLYSGKRSFRGTKRELLSLIERLGQNSPGDIVLVAHSLGGVIVLSALKEISDLPRRIRHILLLGAPTTGAPKARLMWPWFWSRALGPRSSLLVGILKGAESLGVATSGADRHPGLPKVTYVAGAEDTVVGAFAKFTLPGPALEAEADHSIGAVFRPAHPSFVQLRNLVCAPPRSVVEAMTFLRALRLPVSAHCGVIEHRDSGAWVWRVQGSRRESATASSLDAFLASFPESAPGSTVSSALRSAAESPSSGSAELRMIDESTRLLVAGNPNDGLAFALLDTSDPHLAPTSGIATSISSSLSVDPWPLASMLGESCNHEPLLANRGLDFSRLQFAAFVSERGSYYGVYVLQGEVSREPLDSLVFHLGIPVLTRALENLDPVVLLAANDAVRLLELREVERQASCWLIHAAPREPIRPPTKVQISLLFRVPACMELGNVVDAFWLGEGTAASELSIKYETPFPLAAARCVRALGDRTAIRSQQVEAYRKGGASIEFGFRCSEQDRGVGIALDCRRAAVRSRGRSLREIVSIHSAAREDIDVIAALEPLLAVSVPAVRSRIETRFSIFPEGIVVARLFDTVVGYAEMIGLRAAEAFDLQRVLSYEAHDSTGELAYLLFVGVLPAFRSHGLAATLVKEAARRAQEAGKVELLIGVPESSLSTFQDLGFDFSFYASGAAVGLDQLVVMRRSLPRRPQVDS